MRKECQIWEMQKGVAAGSLTPRQLEALQLAADGYGGKEIAAKMFIGHQTLKQYLYEARKTLGVKTTTHAVAIAIRQGIIE